MRKVMRIGTIPCGRRYANLYCTVEDRKDSGELTFTGVVGPLRSGNALGSCGQINMEFAHRNPEDNKYPNPIDASAIHFAPGWSEDKWLDFLDAWNRWHLNNMRAGSKIQEDWLRKYPRQTVYPETHYEKTRKRLARAGLNPDPDGYKYGSRWNREEVPAGVLSFLQSLPTADKTPAWV